MLTSRVLLKATWSAAEPNSAVYNAYSHVSNSARWPGRSIAAQVGGDRIRRRQFRIEAVVVNSEFLPVLENGKFPEILVFEDESAVTSGFSETLKYRSCHDDDASYLYLRHDGQAEGLPLKHCNLSPRRQIAEWMGFGGSDACSQSAALT